MEEAAIGQKNVHEFGMKELDRLVAEREDHSFHPRRRLVNFSHTSILHFRSTFSLFQHFYEIASLMVSVTLITTTAVMNTLAICLKGVTHRCQCHAVAVNDHILRPWIECRLHLQWECEDLHVNLCHPAKCSLVVHLQVVQ